MNIYLHNILVSLSMVLFTVTQGTLSSPGESNYGFEDEVRIELGVPRILTTWIILTTSSFYLVLLRVDGIPAEVQGFPRPPLIWVVWLKLRHWPRTKFLECDLVMFSSSLSFSTFSVSAMFCWASSQIPLLPVSLSACCRHPGALFPTCLSVIMTVSKLALPALSLFCSANPECHLQHSLSGTCWQPS